MTDANANPGQHTGDEFDLKHSQVVLNAEKKEDKDEVNSHSPFEKHVAAG